LSAVLIWNRTFWFTEAFSALRFRHVLRHAAEFGHRVGFDLVRLGLDLCAELLPLREDFHR
jgi:hypothetical protein